LVPACPGDRSRQQLEQEGDCEKQKEKQIIEVHVSKALNR